MYLKKIHLINFKNFEEKELEFSPKINAFVGNNGMGKTNLLDAVYYLSLFKSYFNASDAQNIRISQDFFFVEGWFFKNQKEEWVQCGVKKGEKKNAKRNQKTYERIADHVGEFPVVIISPYDRDLITEGSDVRRKFIDRIISQSDSVYFANLLRYNKVLSQRNALLKYFAANRSFDALQLSIFDEEILKLGKDIFEKRKDFLASFQPKFQKYYAFISQEKEEVEIVYQSDLEVNPETYLEESLIKDKLVQYTTQGVHKDDLKFNIRGHLIKKFGSQGQQKSFLIALKLAELEIIKEQKNVTPILLLDDIFDKLDESRVEQLIKLVNEEHFGQIFISDTHPERTQSIIAKINDDHKVFKL
ncbi:DNA replication/repair protein RecF [Ornithobacterium rhinotracheale]|uniref:DNA replication and repair protein RecF n=1 Tax=Ornithobacterium rhinotracheale TaxID=28251 RepID=A0A410JRZ9_ORNRH|nr:DNA replication/repair protein RecF [Ornithobacterium rhinotracheale]QAR30896.1 DNA replication/repair protein RecF [Ornithobacterium rhinotracheale]